VGKYATKKIVRNIKYQGIPVYLENLAGSYRHWTDHNGKEGKTYMLYPYGFIRYTEAADGEGVDVYIGPDKRAKWAYVVRQMVPDTQEYDEDKVMLGFSSYADAKTAYLAQYDDTRFFGWIDVYPVETFKRKVRQTLMHPGAVKAYIGLS
jgi:hypothetical protein